MRQRVLDLMVFVIEQKKVEGKVLEMLKVALRC
jgi:hypothetical protein